MLGTYRLPVYLIFQNNVCEVMRISSGIFYPIRCTVIYFLMCNNLSKYCRLEQNYSNQSKITALWGANYSTLEYSSSEIMLPEAVYSVLEKISLSLSAVSGK